MAVTSRFVFLAALAALLIGLSACGGGETSTQVQAVVPPFQGVALAVDQGTSLLGGQPRMKTLSASVTQVHEERFSVIFTTKVVTSGTATKSAVTSTVSAPQGVGITNEQLFDWVEKQYPELFPTHEVTSVATVEGNVYEYRGYSTGNYAGICMAGSTCVVGGVYAVGPFNGNLITQYGTMASFACLVNADVCRPKVTTVSPLDGALDVSAKGTVMVFTFSESISNCRDIEGTGEIGTEVKLIATITCNSVAKTVSITPAENRWPFGSRVCLTLTAIKNPAGYASLAPTSCFTTRPVQSPPRLYVGGANTGGYKAVRVVDKATGQLIKEVEFPSTTGFGPAHNMVVDPLSGKLIVIPWGTRRLYFVDLEDQGVTTTDINLGVNQFVTGAFLNGSNFCTVFTRNIVAGVLNVDNQLACWDRLTRVRTVVTGHNFLAEELMYTTRVDLMALPPLSG